MTSLIKQHSTLNRVQKSLSTTRVRTGRGVQAVKVSQPAYQTLKEHKHLSTFFTQTLRSIPSNLFTNNGENIPQNWRLGVSLNSNLLLSN